MFKMPRMMPKITASSMSGFKKSDFSLGTPKRKRRQSIKKMLKNI